MSTDFAEFAAAKGAILISPDDANNISLRGRFNRHGENFTSNLFDALAANNKAEYIGQVAQQDFTKAVDWEKERLKPIGLKSKKILVTLKAVDSPIVMLPIMAHTFKVDLPDINGIGKQMVQCTA